MLSSLLFQSHSSCKPRASGHPLLATRLILIFPYPLFHPPQLFSFFSLQTLDPSAAGMTVLRAGLLFDYPPPSQPLDSPPQESSNFFEPSSFHFATSIALPLLYTSPLMLILQYRATSIQIFLRRIIYIFAPKMNRWVQAKSVSTLERYSLFFHCSLENCCSSVNCV